MRITRHKALLTVIPSGFCCDLYLAQPAAVFTHQTEKYWSCPACISPYRAGWIL